MAPLNGNLHKKLFFSSSSIKIDGVDYHLSDIAKIDFSIHDHFDKWNYSRDFNPARSNGVNNTLTLFLKDERQIEVKFQLMYKTQIKRLEKELIEYYRHGKLHFLKLIDLLEIDDYDEIQEFKKTLSDINK
ncbi:hypothetical protein [Roseivirga misakiensis]|nr:hypothetical protein [Roseivirga misakiensis]